MTEFEHECCSRNEAYHLINRLIPVNDHDESSLESLYSIVKQDFEWQELADAIQRIEDDILDRHSVKIHAFLVVLKEIVKANEND